VAGRLAEEGDRLHVVYGRPEGPPVEGLADVPDGEPVRQGHAVGIEDALGVPELDDARITEPESQGGTVYLLLDPEVALVEQVRGVVGVGDRGKRSHPSSGGRRAAS